MDRPPDGEGRGAVKSRGKRVDRIRLGQAGERAAVRYLKRLGYRILEKDYRLPFAQIDVIAREEKTIVFVEVKARRSETFGLPQEAVTWRKKQRLIKAAGCYLAAKNLSDAPYRFDVVTILYPERGRKILNLIRNAFP